MPELAEVEHARQLWDVALGEPITEVVISRPAVRVFRTLDVLALRERLPGQPLAASESRGKQMVFRFGQKREIWLGLHLGMEGDLRVEPPGFTAGKHDHMLLRQAKRTLVFYDGRHFGRVLFYEGDGTPGWWSKLAPSILTKEFTAKGVNDFLTRRKRAPLKAVLLMQERFPGIGNWMADEILWRAPFHPATPAGSLDPADANRLWRTVRHVSRRAIETISDTWGYPDSWLFSQRWKKGGHCPRCNAKLEKAEIGGRTTCWCPKCQPN